MSAEELRGQWDALIAANAVVEERIERFLESARAIDPGDRESARVRGCC
jgi:hypothetical protein